MEKWLPGDGVCQSDAHVPCSVYHPYSALVQPASPGFGFTSLTDSLTGYFFFFFFVHKLVCTRMFRLVCVLQQQVSSEMTCMAVKEGQEWQKSTCTGVNEHL